MVSYFIYYNADSSIENADSSIENDFRDRWLRRWQSVPLAPGFLVRVYTKQ